MHHAERPALFPEPDPALLADYFTDHIGTDGTYVLVTTDEGGAVVGYGLANTVDVQPSSFTSHGPRLDLHQIVVAQDHEGRGHGSALLRGVESLARELSIDHVWLTVWAFNERASSLFARAGYVPMSQRMCRDTAAVPHSGPFGHAT